MSLFRVNAGTVINLEPERTRKASFGYFSLPQAIIWWTGRFLLWALVNGVVVIGKLIAITYKAIRDERRA